MPNALRTTSIAGTRKNKTPPCIPFGVSQYSAIPAVAATRAANEIAYVNLEVVNTFTKHGPIRCSPVCNTDCYTKLDIHELGNVDAQCS